VNLGMRPFRSEKNEGRSYQKDSEKRENRTEIKAKGIKGEGLDSSIGLRLTSTNKGNINARNGKRILNQGRSHPVQGLKDKRVMGLRETHSGHIKKNG